MTPLPPETAEARPPKKPNWALLALAVVFFGFCVAIMVAGAILFPSFRRYRATMAANTCIRRLGESSRAMAMYAADNDDSLPPASAWMDKLQPLVRSGRAFRCPTMRMRGFGAYGYAMNSALSAGKKSAIADPAATPLLFDSTLLAKNAASGIETLPSPGRHNGGNNVAYADGHASRLAAGSKP